MPPSFASSLLFLLAVPLTLLHRCDAADGNNTTNQDLYYKQCSTSGNFSSSSPYQFNLAQLLAMLPSNAINSSGYFNGTAGSAPDTVFAMAMCQADIPWPDQCNSCLQTAAAGVKAACPSSRNASAGSPGCLVRYSDTPIAGIMNDDIAFDALHNAVNVLKIGDFQLTRRELFTALSASASVSPMLVASGNRTFNGTHTLFGLSQCSRDLSGDDCSKCIMSLVTNIPVKVMWSEGVSLTGFSCYIRYDLRPFPLYGVGNATPEGFLGPKGASLHREEVIGIVVSISIIIMLLVFIVIRHYQKKWKIANILEVTGLKEFSYGEIKSGTANFDTTRNKLGEGGFGEVYKGKFKIKGRDLDLAVKRITVQEAAKQLLDEIKMLARLEHTNVVQLVGFCSNDGWFGFGKSGLYVVNEFFSNGSLDKYISGKKREALSWPLRCKIIRGICAGLQYLHEHCNSTIAHMDIKPNNILLDQSMMPKIADFGLSRALMKAKTHTYTKNTIGTNGYMAPEYMDRGRLGRKCDIYSLGVLILGLIFGDGPTAYHDPCGTRYIDKIRNKFVVDASAMPRRLTAMDTEHLRRDASLANDDSLGDVETCIILALQCVDEEPNNRPTATELCSRLPYVQEN